MSTAIRDVGETLIDLLRNDPIVTIPDAQIALLSPAEANASGVRLTLFLYSISPAAEYRNEMEIAGNEEELDAQGNRVPRPLSLPLNLYYLLTAFSPPQDPTERSLESQLLLGQAMRVFFDNGCLTGSLLRGSLRRDEELRLSLQPITIEDLTRVWSVFPETALQPSVSYLVSPVLLRSDRTRDGARVVSRRLDSDHVVPIASQEQSS